MTVKERIEKINKYKSNFIRGKEAERLIKQLFRKEGVNSIKDINDTVIRDIIIDIADVYHVDSNLLYNGLKRAK